MPLSDDRTGCRRHIPPELRSRHRWLRSRLRDAALVALLASQSISAGGATETEPSHSTSELAHQREAAAAINGVEDARVFLAHYPDGPVAAVRNRRYALQTARVVTEGGEVTSRITTAYDATGNEVRRTWMDGSWKTCTFDDRGHALRCRYYDKAGEAWALIRHDYDETGRPIRARVEEIDGEHGHRTERHAYDRYGDRYRTVTDHSEGSRTVTRFGRDGDGRLLLERERHFDAQGRLTGVARITYAYGADGHHSDRYQVDNDPSGTGMDHIRYSRGEDGRLLRSVHWMRRAGHAFSRTRVYHYDDAGHLVRQTVRTGGGAHKVVRYEYELKAIDFSRFVRAVRDREK